MGLLNIYNSFSIRNSRPFLTGITPEIIFYTLTYSIKIFSNVRFLNNFLFSNFLTVTYNNNRCAGLKINFYSFKYDNRVLSNRL